MFEITYECKRLFQWSSDYIFTSYEDAKTYLTNQGFTKATNGFESKQETAQKAFITPKKVYKA
jgi:hypothetical protein